jgi:hypothetical protein
MKEGYVVFVNDNEIYLSLLDTLIESILLFSTRPVEVFSINFDYRHSSSKVLTKRINLSNVNYGTICYSKLYATLNSSFEYGIQLDCDFIITEKMDLLFETTKTVGEFPLASLHPKDPCNQKNVMDYLKVDKKTQPYVHATYLFSEKTKPFFEQCYNLSQELLLKGITPVNWDETILNVMLWKHECKGLWVDPYDIYWEIFVDGKNWESNGYPLDFNLNFYSCHGLKDPKKAKLILKNLKVD